MEVIEKIGGPERDRTAGLLVANEALSQHSLVLNQSLPNDFLANNPFQLERKWNVRKPEFASRTRCCNPVEPKLIKECLVKNDHDSGAPGASAEGASPLQLEPSVATRKRCKGTKKNGAACTAWAMEGGLCYFHANPDKAAELGRNGGRHRKHTYEQSTEHVAVPESAADVKRMLAETMAEVKAGKMDPKVASTVAYIATVLLRAYETDSAPSADTPAQPYVPLIYRSLMYRDGRRHEPDDVIDLETGERVVLPVPEVPCALPAPLPSSAAPMETSKPKEQFETDILIT